MISVIVPIYNVKEYLDRCISSIVKQTYRDIEIILVNDGSTDNPDEILKRWASIDSRIIVINKENGGLSDARNKGIEYASGEYYTFVDSDDVLNIHFLEHLINLMENENCDMVACAHTYFSKDNEIDIENGCTHYSSCHINFMDYMHLYMGENKVQAVTAWGKLYKSCLFDDIRYPKGRIREDEFTTYKLVAKAKKVIFSNAKYYYYFLRNNSIMSIRSAKSSFDYLCALDERDIFIVENYPGIVSEWGKWLFDESIRHYLDCYSYLDKTKKASLNYYIDRIFYAYSYNSKWHMSILFFVKYFPFFSSYLYRIKTIIVNK